MRKQVIPVCPVCKQDLIITGLHCDHCDISIAGQFTLTKFDYLTPEQLGFVEIFIKNQGNIKAIEKEMNISYPTVKKLLSDVILALGYETVDEVETTQTYSSGLSAKGIAKGEVLKMVADKILSVEEAIEILKKDRR